MLPVILRNVYMGSENGDEKETFREKQPYHLYLSDIYIQGVPPGHKHLNIGRIKLDSSITFI
jgi:hypothetical protein